MKEENIDKTLRSNLLSTLYNFRADMRNLIKHHDLTLQQYQVMEIVGGSETELTTAEISGQMVDKYADTSRVVDRLIIKGLLKKEQNKTDKRKVQVSPTIRGKALLQRMQFDNEKLNELTSGLNKVEKSWMVDLLGKLRN